MVGWEARSGGVIEGDGGGAGDGRVPLNDSRCLPRVYALSIPMTQNHQTAELVGLKNPKNHEVSMRDEAGGGENINYQQIFLTFPAFSSSFCI